MIAHFDCLSQWQNVLFQAHDIFPEFATKAQLSWSKNVNEECDTPWRLCWDPKTQFIVCLLVWLFGWSSIWQPDKKISVPMCDFTIPGGGDKSNDFVANILWDKVFYRPIHCRQRWAS